MCSLNLGTTGPNSGQCVGSLAGLDLGLGNGVWLLGDRYVVEASISMRSADDRCDSFMKNVYTAFSVSQNAVGFAKLK